MYIDDDLIKEERKTKKKVKRWLEKREIEEEG
jgi:hypothetical protein